MAKKTIILVNPQHHKNWIYGESVYSFPIAPLYVGTALKTAGFPVILADTCVHSDYMDTIRGALDNCAYVGFSVMTPQVPHAYEIAQEIRRIAPDLALVWGGVHPTLYPDAVQDPYCDVTVMGEGEAAAVALAEYFSGEPDPARMAEIHNIAYELDGIVHRTPDAPLIEMDTLPFVDYTLLDSEKYIESYVVQEQRMARVIPIHAARGCPWHCTFCINTTLNAERRYRARSADNLLDEIQALAEKYNLEGIMLQDEEFFASRRRVVEFLDGIEARGMQHLKYYATSRVNHFRPGYIDKPFLKRLKECGFVDLLFGFECGSPYCLELVQKEITVDQGLYAAKLLADAGFKAVWGFIMAIPGESRRDILRTITIMEKIRKMSRDIYFIGPQIFRPYPGSELYRKALESGLTEPATLREWADFSFSSEGWLGSDHLPWINPDDLEFVNYINYVAPVYFNRRFLRASPKKKVFHSILRGLFRIRLSLDLWVFPVEHRVKPLLERVSGLLP